MKILLAVNSLSAGGAETFVAALAKEYRRRGNDVALFLYAGVLDAKGYALFCELSVVGVQIVIPESRNPLVIVWTLRRLIHSFSPEIIHSHLEQSDFWVLLARYFWLFRKIKLVRTLHSVYATKKLPKIIHKLLAFYYHLHVACGPIVLSQYPFLGKKSLTIANGVSCPEISHLNLDDLRVAHNIAYNQCWLVCVGSFGIRNNVLPKAQDIIIRAMAYLADKNIVVTFLGDGAERLALEHLAHSLGVSERCIFLGVVADVGQYLRASDGLVMPSRFEGLPLTCIEALLCNKPMILSDIQAFDFFDNPSCIRAKVDNAIDLANKIDEFSVRRYELQEAAENYGAVAVANFSIGTSADHYLAGYTAL